MMLQESYIRLKVRSDHLHGVLCQIIRVDQDQLWYGAAASYMYAMRGLCIFDRWWNGKTRRAPNRQQLIELIEQLTSILRVIACIDDGGQILNCYSNSVVAKMAQQGLYDDMFVGKFLNDSGMELADD